IAQLGDKAQAKTIARSSGCPVIPGSDGVVSDLDEAVEVAKELGFPIFIKAVAGGGGKGIRIAHSIDEFARLFLSARAEAEANFGNPGIYLEKMIVNPRHVEIQILGDKHGNYVHFGERDCSIQRRRQKLIEESPSPILTDSLREEMGAASIALAKAAGYYSAGTVEFLVDQDRQFYFMEVNTRIQVEHTVSEECYHVDLVKEQLRVARGETICYKQEELRPQHHVIQFRINAENPSQNFTPSPGKLTEYLPPGGPNVRFDSACYPDCTISPFYDSMIAKLIVRGRTREEAIATARRVLGEFYISGVHTTVPFHTELLTDQAFLSGEYTIRYIDDEMEKGRVFGDPSSKNHA
ncbi:MAG: acetyl-CoA carboxylase biotin carboxylase subunit, partial [Chlamydiia bacterium]|nr:acetyl-CoA carboxylase biotin carboxylase subunit [Chlamydiia bacterium]